MQSGGQSICPSSLVTVPSPLSTWTVSVVPLSSSNVAVTSWSWSMATVQSPVPEQSPLQPVKIQPGSALAVSVTVGHPAEQK